MNKIEKNKIIIEPLMRDNIDNVSETINVYCFCGQPKIVIKFFNNNKMSIWDEKFKPMDNIFNFFEENMPADVDDLIYQTFCLSKRLSENFIFVRVDWMIYRNKIWFEELTFTPYSGFNKFKKNADNIKYGQLINLQGE